MGRFLSNIYDHRRPDAEQLMCHSYDDWLSGYEARRQAWQHHLSWIRENVIGPPEASEKYSVAQLEAMGMVGIYAPDDVEAVT